MNHESRIKEKKRDTESIAYMTETFNFRDVTTDELLAGVFDIITPNETSCREEREALTSVASLPLGDTTSSHSNDAEMKTFTNMTSCPSISHANPNDGAFSRKAERGSDVSTLEGEGKRSARCPTVDDFPPSQSVRSQKRLCSCLGAGSGYHRQTCSISMDNKNKSNF